MEVKRTIMNKGTKTVIVGILGVLIFGVGAGLRVQAEKLSTTSIEHKPGQSYSSTTDYDLQVSIIDVSRGIVYTGGALIVLSLTGWLFAQKQDTIQS